MKKQQRGMKKGNPKEMVSLPSQEERGNLDKPDTAVAFARRRESKSGKRKGQEERKRKERKMEKGKQERKKKTRDDDSGIPTLTGLLYPPEPPGCNDAGGPPVYPVGGAPL